MVELPPQVVKALLDVGVSRAEVEAAWASLSPGSRHGLGLARRLLERGAAQPAQLERALGGSRPAAPPQPQLAGYTLVRPLGRGGMGEVFLARDAQGREFALKRVSEVQDTVLVARFMREIRALCALEHPHLARIHDAGVVGQTPYYVLDLYPGGSLAERIAGGPLDPEEARGVALKLAAALDVVHAQGLVHRDVKPENVLFDAEGEPRLADFGLATAGERSLAGGRLTLTAEVLGTPAYMAPEQALDASQVGPAADVYALGAVLYAMLCGRPPFTGDSLLEVLSALLDRAPTPPHKLAPRVPLALSEVCLRALAKEPEGRYPDVRAFALALGDARARTGAPRRALALLGLSAIAAAVAGVAAWQAWRAGPRPGVAPRAGQRSLARRRGLARGAPRGRLGALVLGAAGGRVGAAG
ncbi:MAG: serine/threonine-protein kinase [Planctomycetota bacterium]